jgi:hypothetical protein
MIDCRKNLNASAASAETDGRKPPGGKSRKLTQVAAETATTAAGKSGR